MRVSSRVDYAVRAAVELAVRSPDRSSPPSTREQLAAAQDIPTKYLEAILGGLRRAGLVGSRRGADGGYWLARPATSVTIADVVRAVEGPLADVRGEPPEDLHYPGPAAPLERVWVAARASLRRVLEQVTLADVVAGRLPPTVEELLSDPEAWTRR